MERDHRYQQKKAALYRAQREKQKRPHHKKRHKEKHESRLDLVVVIGILGMITILTSRDQKADASQNSVQSQPLISPAACAYAAPASSGELSLVGVKYYAGELNSFPAEQVGVSNVYGEGEALNANTSSGEPFNPNGLTAASWFYPLGTSVEVCDTGNGNCVSVRINDRGPNRRLAVEQQGQNVIIDLAHAAFRHLEPNPHVGRINVKVRPLCQ